MKKIVALLTLFPLIAFADLGPRPTYVHRLHRVGYETLVEEGDLSPAMTDAGIGIAVCAVVLGVLMILLLRTRFAKKCGQGIATVASFLAAREKVGYVIVGLFVLSFSVFFAYKFCRSVRQEFVKMGGGNPGRVYADEPGWKYEDDGLGRPMDLSSLNRVRLLANKITRRTESAVKESAVKGNADVRTRQEEMGNQVLLNGREQIRRQREGGAPEWVHREHALHLRRMEMHHEIAREGDLGTTYLNYGHGMDMRSAVNEYRNWLDRRVCEGKERASSERQRTRNGDDAAAWRSVQRAVE